MTITDDLVILIHEIETILKGTGFKWLLRQDDQFGYFANIYNERDLVFPAFHDNTSQALKESLRQFIASHLHKD